MTRCSTSVTSRERTTRIPAGVCLTGWKSTCYSASLHNWGVRCLRECTRPIDITKPADIFRYVPKNGAQGCRDAYLRLGKWDVPGKRNLGLLAHLVCQPCLPRRKYASLHCVVTGLFAMRCLPCGFHGKPSRFLAGSWWFSNQVVLLWKITYFHQQNKLFSRAKQVKSRRKTSCFGNRGVVPGLLADDLKGEA